MPPSLSFGSRVERVELRGESDELWSARRSHRVVKTKSNSLCLIGGLAEGDSAGDVWLCKDGATRTTSEGVLQTTWSCVCSRTAFRSRDGHAAVVTSAGSILVLGGASTQVDLLTTSQVWKSEDEGSTWNLVTSAPGWSARTHHEAVVLKDSVFVVGGFGEFGYCNDSWISSDQGETWRRASSSAPWSKRAMHAATSFRGAIYLSGGYEDRGSPCNDVWASKDAASWTRLAHRAPWRPRRGHTLCAAGDDCLILTGGESGAQNSQNSESFGDCWTSRDGATWSLVCFDAPPRQFHASVCHDRTLIVFGGAEAINSRNNDSKKSRAERSKTHSDAWAVDIRENVAPTLGSMAPSFSPRMECIDISTSSVVAYISELQQLRAALREVQRGNVQLVQLVSNATECAELRHALRFAASAKGHDEPFAIKPVAAKTPMRSMSQETLSSRFQRAWSNCKSSSTSLLDEKHNEDDGESVVPPESVNSYFDAREDDSESSHSGTPPPLSTPTTNEVGVLPEAGATPFLTDTFLGVVKDAFAIDSEIDAHWREKIWPLLRETGEEAVRRPESRDLAACVERRAQAFKDATDALATAEARYSSLETESLCLRKRASLALLQIRARLAVESEQRITTQRCTAIARICDTASFNDLQRTAMTAIASNDGSHVDEGDPQPLFVGDTGEAEALFSAEDKMMLEAIQGRDDRENFEIVAADLRAHCTRPERANSARRATDTALTRLAGAFEARADAADALRASIHYTATNKQENDDSIKVEEEVSLRTLAAATLWDEGISLCKAKLDAHAAIGRELSIIPCELDQALALKRRLLRAAENRCLEVSLRVRIILSVIAALQRRARAWAVYLNTGDAVKRAVSLCKKAAIARDDVVAIEDQKSDAIAAIEKVARRRRAACSLDRRRIACSRQESCGAGWVETGAANPTTAESGAFEHMLSLSTGLVFTNAAQPEVLSKETSAPEDFFIASNATTIPSPEQQECRLTESIRVSNQGHLDTCSESANTAGEPHAQSISAQCRSSIELQDVRQVQPSLEEVEYEFARKVNFLEAKLCEARQMRRRSIANAARCAYIEAPEVARDNSIIVDALGRFKLLGVEGDDIDSKESIGKSMFFAPSSKPKQTTQNSHRSIDTQGAWARNLNRHLDEFCAFKPISSEFPRSLRAVDRASGDAVLLKAYALNEGENAAAWRDHEVEIDALLTLPRHEAIAAPRSIVSPIWAPVVSIDESQKAQVSNWFAEPLKTLPSTCLSGMSSRSEMNSGAAMIYLEFALPQTNGIGWAMSSSVRAPWHIQSIARQILTAILILHSSDVVHGHISPQTVVLLGEKRAQLATRNVIVANRDNDEINFDCEEFMAPELLHGETPPTMASDVYSFAATLRWLHARSSSGNRENQRVSKPRFSRSPSITVDEELGRLLKALMASNPAERPSAADALLHPYFQNSYMDRYIAGGDLVDPNEKLEALRNLIRQVQSELRSLPSRREILVRREFIVDDVLNHFSEGNVRSLQRTVMKTKGSIVEQHHVTRWPVRVTFEGEDGVDEGGLTVEMFRLFFDGALDAASGLFESSGGDVVLPKPRRDQTFLSRMEAFGRALVTACYEGCGAPPRLGPSMFKFLARGARHDSAGDGRALRDLQKFDPQLGASLEYMLTHSPETGTDWGLEFDDAELGSLSEQERPRAVNEANKHSFVVLKVRYVLTESRLDALLALRRGFENALYELSPEASPFLKLFSSTDWRVMLSSDDDDLKTEQVVDTLKFVGFPNSSIIPDAFRRTCASFSIDSLRRFLVFATGSPSLPRNRSQDFSIQVRAQLRSNALPVAHVCFFHIDVPDYEDKQTFVTKLLIAIHECGTFDRL